jgi:hypothetical protein
MKIIEILLIGKEVIVFKSINKPLIKDKTQLILLLNMKNNK